MKLSTFFPEWCGEMTLQALNFIRGLLHAFAGSLTNSFMFTTLCQLKQE